MNERNYLNAFVISFNFLYAKKKQQHQPENIFNQKKKKKKCDVKGAIKY